MGTVSKRERLPHVLRLKVLGPVRIYRCHESLGSYALDAKLVTPVDECSLNRAPKDSII